MKVTIDGHHMQTGESLQEYVNERSGDVVSKYFPNAISMHIVFEKQCISSLVILKYMEQFNVNGLEKAKQRVGLINRTAYLLNPLISKKCSGRLVGKISKAFITLGTLSKFVK